MMAKITTGTSFGGALDYDRDKNQQNQKIVTFLDSCGVDMNYKADGTPDPDMKAVVRSFEIQAALNPKVSKPVVHIALTFKPEDKPRLSNAYMVKLAKEYMLEMGFTNTQYVIHRHEETRNPHVHITLNRVDNEGKRISDSNELRRNAAVCKAITLREGLTWGESKVISQAKVNDKSERFRYNIAKTVYQCLQKSSTLTQFQHETARHGIETTLKRSESSGKVIGITFTAKDSEGKEHVFKGSKLGKELTAGAVLKSLGQEKLLDKSAKPELSIPEQEKAALKQTLFSCIANIKDIRDLPKETARFGIETHFKTNPNTGKIQGVTFTYKDTNGQVQSIKGSAIDRQLSAGNILKMIETGVPMDKAAGGGDFSSKFFPAEEVKEAAPERSSVSVQDAALSAGEILFAGIFSGGGSKQEEDEEIGKKKDRGISY
ncbi:MAG: relaxase/mobilization nuclease domain-containing protein [Bacteroidales bacterium]|nr:relaxase/mobilization nuclease domain-containing protein [Bacteroidales bacterium]